MFWDFFQGRRALERVRWRGVRWDHARSESGLLGPDQGLAAASCIALEAFERLRERCWAQRARPRARNRKVGPIVAGLIIVTGTTGARKESLPSRFGHGSSLSQQEIARRSTEGGSAGRADYHRSSSGRGATLLPNSRSRPLNSRMQGNQSGGPSFYEANYNLIAAALATAAATMLTLLTTLSDQRTPWCSGALRSKAFSKPNCW